MRCRITRHALALAQLDFLDSAATLEHLVKNLYLPAPAVEIEHVASLLERGDIQACEKGPEDRCLVRWRVGSIKKDTGDEKK